MVLSRTVLQKRNFSHEYYQDDRYFGEDDRTFELIMGYLSHFESVQLAAFQQQDEPFLVNESQTGVEL